MNTAVLPSQDNRLNLLYLVHRLPYPPDKGDRIRAYQLLRYLAPKANVHLACLADEPVEPEQLEALRHYCTSVAAIEIGPMRWVRAAWSTARGRTITEGAFSSEHLRAVLRQWTQATRFDVCLASASSMVPYLRLPELRHLPAVVDLVDVDSQKWLDYAAAGRGPRSWLYRLEGLHLRRLEASLPAWARAVTLVSEAEADIYRAFAGAEGTHVVGNGVDLDYFRPRPQSHEACCIFLGALNYHPNVDGIVWFCTEVWPNIRRLLPEAKIHLVGRRPAPVVQRLAQLPGVVLVGQVADVRPELARAAVALVPLRIARGVQNKVLEAMAMAKPTVVSPSCLAGLGAEATRNLLVASSAEDWTQSVVRLLQNPELRHQLGKAGRDYVVQNHRWDRCLRPLDGLLGLPSPTDPQPHLPLTDGSDTVRQHSLDLVP